MRLNEILNAGRKEGTLEMERVTAVNHGVNQAYLVLNLSLQLFAPCSWRHTYRLRTCTSVFVKRKWKYLLSRVSEKIK